MKVTRFWDSSSGGSQKTSYRVIFIAAEFQDAIDHFIDRFGRDPRNVTCKCCGKDYDIRTFNSLQQASAYFRDCKEVAGSYVEEPRDSTYSQYQTVDEFLDEDDILFIEDING